MACPINARGTDFSFQTNKLSKTIRRDLGRYSTFFPDGSIQAGEGSLLLLLSNSLIAFMMI